MQPQRVVCKDKGEIGSPFSYVETEKTPRFIYFLILPLPVRLDLAHGHIKSSHALLCSYVLFFKCS